jgi:hypothetical protein
VDDGFFYNYYMAAKALVAGLSKSVGQSGRSSGVAAALDRRSFQISNGGMVKLDSRRQAIRTKYQLQLVKNADGSVGATDDRVRAGRRSVVRRSLQTDEPAPRSHAARVQEAEDPWQGRDQGRHGRQGDEPDPEVGA